MYARFDRNETDDNRRQMVPQIVDRRELLKIKVKSLAAEAKIIRHEEKKIGTVRYVQVDGRIVKGTEGREDKYRPSYVRRVRYGLNPLAHEMWAHRTKHLREEARLTHIAYGLIRGKSLEKIEGNAKVALTSAQWDRIRAMVRKYGSAELQEKFKAMPGEEKKAA